MKTRKNLYLVMLISAVLLIVFNGILFYSTKCTGEYLQTVNVWGVSSSIRQADFNRQKQLIRNLPGDMKEAKAYVQEVLSYLENKKEKDTKEIPDTALLMGVDDADRQNYQRILQCINQNLSYGDYVRGVASSAQDIASVIYPIYEDSWVLKNGAQSEVDYYGLEYLKLSLVLDDGINVMLQYHITDFIALALLVLFAFLFYLYMKNQTMVTIPNVRGALVGTILLSVLAVVGLYVGNIYLAARQWGILPAGMAIQSLPAFYTCSYAITLGGFLALWILLKLGTLFLILFLGVYCLSGKHGWAYLAGFLAFLGLEFFLNRLPGDGAAEVFFREVNIFSGFSAERFFNRYLNLDVLGVLFPRFRTYGICFAIAFAVVSFFMFHRLRWYQARATQAVQQAYFEEIEKRYQETRRLWHDFHNHLLAIKALYDVGNYTEADRYIDALSQQSRAHLLPVKTGSNVVDLLLFKKHQQALEKDIKIRFTMGCLLQQLSHMDYDLCSLLGNLLDNAMEALEGLAFVNREIILIMKEQNSMLYISCENPFEGERTQEEGQFLTTKKDVTNHGIGLQSVRQICKKYKGSMEISTKEQRFLVTILLNEK